MDKFREAIRAMVKEEMSNMLPKQEHDHEAKMAKGELRDMITNGAELYKMIQEGDNLPGWVSAYITLASDYMHSVYEYMTEKQEN
jgi:serine protease inhibitor